MKTLDLDLQAIGLTEMKEQETRDVDGGGWMATTLGYICGTIASVVDAYGEAMDNHYAMSGSFTSWKNA